LTLGYFTFGGLQVSTIQSETSRKIGGMLKYFRAKNIFFETLLTTCLAMLAAVGDDKTFPEESMTDWRSAPNRGITKNRSFLPLKIEEAI